MRHSSLRRALVPILTSTLVVAAAGLVAEGSASACAILPSSASDPPSMSTEQVLILYDPPSQIEHFIREVRFQRVKARFAFLVPTPSRPEIAKVEKPPFEYLAQRYSFRPPPEPESGFDLFAGKAAVLSAPVVVLEIKQVGSFTAFVLAATDGQALDQWLKDNDITRPGNAVPWLQHFVDLKFYFTALRYEPTKTEGPDAGDMASETVRLTFKTPEAYYPYLEPAQSGPPPPGRDLRIWTISQEKLVPVAYRSVPGQPIRWASAWTAGHTYEESRERLADFFPGVAAFLPSESDLEIQTFEDFKSSRDGWGDVVLASEGQNPDDPAFQAHAASLLGSSPLHSDPGEAQNPPAADALRVAYASRGCACEIGARTPTPGPLVILAAILLGLSRRKGTAPVRERFNQVL
jgi:Uncharacterized protein conserved in bacteria (DUF2330)